jgi:hypothetical protein
MKNNLINKNEFDREDGLFFYCDNCLDRVPAIADFWYKGYDEPHRIELISYDRSHFEVLVEKRDVQPNLDKDENILYNCGQCGSPVDEGYDIEFLNICTYFEVFPVMKSKN